MRRTSASRIGGRSSRHDVISCDRLSSGTWANVFTCSVRRCTTCSRTWRSRRARRKSWLNCWRTKFRSRQRHVAFHDAMRSSVVGSCATIGVSLPS
jgi:hypothetical protein